MILVLLSSMALSGLGPFCVDDAPDWQTEVRPLLSDRCFACHGPDAAGRQADLRLDQPLALTGSVLLERLRSDDPERRMPPPESKLELSEEEVDLLERWVAAGAPFEAHWSFQELHRPEAVSGGEDWARDPLDERILAYLRAEGRQPAAEADRGTWLRRVHLHLTGLPPSPEDQRAFLEDESADAHERVVDELLASWEHAEHAAATWLDLARYADSYGYQADRERRVWPWRDWLLRSLHDNLPYDQFVLQQVAGDLLPEAGLQERLATTFSRLHRQTNEGGSVEEEFRVESVADRVQTMGAAFLGLTFECARCHDHKFDPLTQREYFQLFAFFDDIDEAGLYSHFTGSVPTPALDLPSDAQRETLAAAEAKVERLEISAVPARSEPDLHVGLQGAYSLDGEFVAGFGEVEPAKLAGPKEWVASRRGQGLQLTGDDALQFPGVGHFRRSDPFSIALDLWLPQVYERAVVLHRSRAWTDAASRGFEVLIEDGRASVALIHYWPGDALRVQTVEPLPVEEWLHLGLTYDGSSRAAGLRLFVNGAAVATEVVRDGLRRTIVGGGEQHLTVGERFRDRGLRGGRVDELVVYAREVNAAEMAELAQATPAASTLLALGAQPLAPAISAHDAWREELRAARRARDDARDAIPQIMTMRDLPQPRTAYLLARGSYDAPAEAVQPDTPAFLPALPASAPRNRLGLARWLVNEAAPLVARVEVDRLWRSVFDRGFSETPEDFGLQGHVPERRELLDELAADLIESGWDRRALLRRLVLSSTYRQSLRRDDSVGLGRVQPAVLPAEAVRDAWLATSGLLVSKIGGPPVKPYQPPGLWKEVSGQQYVPSKGEGLWRRSLYTFWKRTAPPPSMLLYGAPSREVCVTKRQEARSPLQVLAAWNDIQAVEAARVLAERVVDSSPEDSSRLEEATRRVWSRAPSPQEAALLNGLLSGAREHYQENPDAAQELLAVGEAPTADEQPPAELAAWTTLIQVLWSHEEATTIP